MKTPHLFQWSETVLITLVKPIYSRLFIGALSLQLGENLKICIESHLMSHYSRTIRFWIWVCEKTQARLNCVLTQGKFFPASPTFLGGECCLTLLQKELPKCNDNLTISMADSVYKMCKSDSQKSLIKYHPSN